MCGLFGALSTRLTSSEISNVCELAVMSSLRGMDSTGVAVFSEKKNKVKRTVYKVKGDSIGFLMSDRADDVLNKTNNVFAVLGHCRAATVGAVNETNAHPIEEKHITGCHNGTISKFAPPKERLDFETDSRVLYQKIANQGLEPTLKEVGWDGAYALTYANFSNMTINFIRNEKRPLWFMYNKARNTLYWASERGMLALLAERKGESSFEQPFPLNTETLWSFKMATVAPKIQKLDVKPTYTPSVPVTHVRFREVPPEKATPTKQLPLLPGPSSVTKPGCDDDCCDRQTYDDWLAKNAGISEEAAAEAKHSKNPFCSSSEVWYRGWGNFLVPPEKALEAIKRGCVNCGDDSMNLNSEVYWIGWKDVICSDCLDDHLMKCKSSSQVVKGELVSED